jgi:hypothetical protein
MRLVTVVGVDGEVEEGRRDDSPILLWSLARYIVRRTEKGKRQMGEGKAISQKKKKGGKKRGQK